MQERFETGLLGQVRSGKKMAVCTSDEDDDRSPVFRRKSTKDKNKIKNIITLV